MTVLKRIMPCLLYNGKNLVKTVNFKRTNYIGDPINAVKIYNDKQVDELVLLDITATKENRKPNFQKIEKIASECFMPFAYGGGVSTLEDFRTLYNLGVEKVIVNNLLRSDPSIVRKASERFGAQSIVASVDVKSNLFGKLRPFAYAGKKIKQSLEAYIEAIERLNIGEILLYSVDRDGTYQGFDTKLVRSVASITNLPLVVTGGAGSIEDIKEVLYKLDVNAAALGSMAVYQKKGMGVLIGFPDRRKVIQDEYI